MEMQPDKLAPMTKQIFSTLDGVVLFLVAVLLVVHTR